MGLIPGQEDALEKEMATHSSILDWEIPWTEEAGGPQSMGSQRVRHNLVTRTTTRTTSLKALSPQCSNIGGLGFNTWNLGGDTIHFMTDTLENRIKLRAWITRGLSYFRVLQRITEEWIKNELSPVGGAMGWLENFWKSCARSLQAGHRPRGFCCSASKFQNKTVAQTNQDAPTSRRATDDAHGTACMKQTLGEKEKWAPTFNYPSLHLML